VRGRACLEARAGAARAAAQKALSRYTYIHSVIHSTQPLRIDGALCGIAAPHQSLRQRVGVGRKAGRRVGRRPRRSVAARGRPRVEARRCAQPTAGPAAEAWRSLHQRSDASLLVIRLIRCLLMGLSIWTIYVLCMYIFMYMIDICMYVSGVVYRSVM